jgi:hypothetical protein
MTNLAKEATATSCDAAMLLNEANYLQAAQRHNTTTGVTFFLMVQGDFLSCGLAARSRLLRGNHRMHVLFSLTPRMHVLYPLARSFSSVGGLYKI